MRVIEKQMLKAIEARKDWHGANTAVHYLSAQETGNPHGSRAEVYLHGNHIADYWYGSGIEVNKDTLFRWPTPTTCSRLRALGVRVNVLRGIPHIDGQPI